MSFRIKTESKCFFFSTEGVVAMFQLIRHYHRQDDVRLYNIVVYNVEWSAIDQIRPDGDRSVWPLQFSNPQSSPIDYCLWIPLFQRC